MKENFFLRLIFKAYFPTDAFHHFHQTIDHLLLKIFSSENYLNKISTHIITDQKIANEALTKSVKQYLQKLNDEDYDNLSLQKKIQNSLVYADRQTV